MNSLPAPIIPKYQYRYREIISKKTDKISGVLVEEYPNWKLDVSPWIFDDEFRDVLNEAIGEGVKNENRLPTLEEFELIFQIAINEYYVSEIKISPELEDINQMRDFIFQNYFM